MDHGKKSKKVMRKTQKSKAKRNKKSNTNRIKNIEKAIYDNDVIRGKDAIVVKTQEQISKYLEEKFNDPLVFDSDIKYINNKDICILYITDRHGMYYVAYFDITSVK
jgi:hypothetical protein